MLNARGKSGNSCVICTDGEWRVGWSGHWGGVLNSTAKREDGRIEVDVVRQARIGGIGDGRRLIRL